MSCFLPSICACESAELMEQYVCDISITAPPQKPMPDPSLSKNTQLLKAYLNTQYVIFCTFIV